MERKYSELIPNVRGTIYHPELKAEIAFCYFVEGVTFSPIDENEGVVVNGIPITFHVRMEVGKEQWNRGTWVNNTNNYYRRLDVSAYSDKEVTSNQMHKIRHCLPTLWAEFLSDNPHLVTQAKEVAIRNELYGLETEVENLKEQLASKVVEFQEKERELQCFLGNC